MDNPIGGMNGNSGSQTSGAGSSELDRLEQAQAEMRAFQADLAVMETVQQMHNAAHTAILKAIQGIIG